MDRTAIPGKTSLTILYRVKADMAGESSWEHLAFYRVTLSNQPEEYQMLGSTISARLWSGFSSMPISSAVIHQESQSWANPPVAAPFCTI